MSGPGAPLAFLLSVCPTMLFISLVEKTGVILFMRNKSQPVFPPSFHPLFTRGWTCHTCRAWGWGLVRGQEEQGTHRGPEKSVSLEMMPRERKSGSQTTGSHHPRDLQAPLVLFGLGLHREKEEREEETNS